VDHPANGNNVGFYRVGKKLNAQGIVTGGWGPWVQVPNWMSNQNQGAGIAVANFGAGELALVVFQIQHLVPGPNKGLFSIGHNVDANGNITGGWTNWTQVPNWISWSDQGAAIAIGDVDGDGQPDLIVFHIDDFHTGHPNLPNKGFYRVGAKLTPKGDVSSWTDWIQVDWFSWFNQGAGVAIADLDGNGRPEITIFQIDNPPGENAGFTGWVGISTNRAACRTGGDRGSGSTTGDHSRIRAEDLSSRPLAGAAESGHLPH
jgi:FG-GAP repeat